MKILIFLIGTLFLAFSSYAQIPQKGISCITKTSTSNLYFYIEVKEDRELNGHALSAYWMKRTGRYSHSKELIFTAPGFLRLYSDSNLIFIDKTQGIELNVDLKRPLPSSSGNKFQGYYSENSKLDMSCTLFYF